MRLGVKVLSHPALLAASLFYAASAQAEPFAAKYQIYFGGLHVLNAEAQWQRTAEGYYISGVAETQGMLGWFSPWKGTTESVGRLEAGKVVPTLHVNRGNSSRGEKLVRLTYDAAGNVTVSQIEPAQDWDDRHPLPDNAEIGTIDPLSVVAGLSELLRKGGSCEGEFQVFDGRKRYDLLVSDAGTTTLEPTSYSIFAGEAQGCRIDYKLLGGHRKERNKYAETAQERIVWVARPREDAPLVPVRLQIETAFGTVMGHLTGFSDVLAAETKLTELTANSRLSE